MKKKRRKEPKRCEGWRKTGAFQMGGTGRWDYAQHDSINGRKGAECCFVR